MTTEPQVLPKRRCRLVFVAEVASEVQMVRPDDEVPIDPGDTWGVSVALRHSGTRFALRYHDAQALAAELSRVLAEIDADIKKHCEAE